MLKENKDKTIKINLTRENLKKIIDHCDLKGKALFLFLLSSGIRIGEALKLKLEDINLEQDPALVIIKGEYTRSGNAYYTFISKEAKETLIEWLKIREEYIKSSLHRGQGLSKTGYGRGIKKQKDDRIFPFSLNVAEQIWYNAIKKARLEEKDEYTKRKNFHIYMLRKFFVNQLKLIVPNIITEALIGRIDRLNNVYKIYTIDQIAEIYKKAEPYLYINIPKEIGEIQTHFQNEIEEIKKRIEDLTIKLTDINTTTIKFMTENIELKNRFEIIEEELQGIKIILKKFLKEK
jgi:integrase